jgi:methylated-DNA-[protein]-cysteine S-methyltransferase
VRAEQTRYAVPGWGSGELWTSDDAVLAHEFEFDDEADPELRGVRSRAASRAAPLEGAASPPTGTVPRSSARMGNAVAPTRRQPPERALRLDADELVERLAAFLAGSEEPLDDVSLDLDGYTPFQRAVAESLRAVPRGEVVSYGELAALAGYPGAQRAVGTFCARNRFSFLLPCHRVVAADGIGSYGRVGVAVKRRLLALEGVVL